MALQIFYLLTQAPHKHTYIEILGYTRKPFKLKKETLAYLGPILILSKTD